MFSFDCSENLGRGQAPCLLLIGAVIVLEISWSVGGFSGGDFPGDSVT
jgi:hypothetical protein